MHEEECRCLGCGSDPEHPVGFRSGSRRGDTAESEFSYDAYNRLTKIEDEVWTSSSTHAQKSKFEYDFDVVHNLVKERYAKVGGSVGDRFAECVSSGMLSSRGECNSWRHGTSYCWQ
jgi:hypothetical protein